MRFVRMVAALEAVLLCATCAVHADVFLRRPGSGGAGGGAVRTAFPEHFAGARKLHSEPVETGGRSGELEVGFIPLGLDVIAPSLAGKIVSGPDSLRLELPPGAGGWKTRYLLLPGVERGTTAYFKMQIPPGKPRPGAWPPELPALPGGATPEELIHYPARGAWYGAFRQPLAPDLALAQMAGMLENQGWRPLSGEASQRGGTGRGELFLHPSPRRVLWVNFDSDGSGAVYVRPVKKP